MKRWIPAFAGMTITWVAPAFAQTPTQPAPSTYAKDSAWLCLPGRTDICSAPLATTVLTPDGYGSTGQSSVAKNPGVDCFYVYPTVSNDRGLNSDMVAGREERLMTQTQFARFASVCRPFAPVYRQMTLASIAAYATGTDVTQAGLMAYRDVRDAFRQFLRVRGGDRPFVLIGHSQGSLMLQQLIAEVIEKDPALRRRMRLAILPGYNLLVPRGRLVGGTFQRTPLCSRPGETGCVLSWVSFRERNVPPAGAIFGIADKPGMTVACTNPAWPGAAGWQPLDSYWYAYSSLSVAGGPIAWSSEGAPPSPFLRTDGLVSARCVNDGPRGYLSVRTNADPNDKRTDRIGGEVSVLGMFVPGWGMHLADMAIAQGDLVRQVGELGARGRSTAK
ncbi:MAG: DUF3089 domain-containing protein [Sphingomicrobium sp.]